MDKIMYTMKVFDIQHSFLLQNLSKLTIQKNGFNVEKSFHRTYGLSQISAFTQLYRDIQANFSISFPPFE